MEKTSRQDKIIELIELYEVDTQAELADLLNGVGYDVTQATVSRDIKELGLIKVSGREKKFRYAVNRADDRNTDNKNLTLFKNCVLSVDNANNLIVVKTLSGHGNSAGIIIDDMKLPDILGSIAGDDTILIVAKSETSALAVVEKLRKILH